MKASLRGGLLPESEADYKRLESAGLLVFNLCRECEDAFTPKNTHTCSGWAETQISGWCEDCFDALFKEPSDNETKGDEP